jgi:6-phosphofructo-2-kinase/fructose-2,6-biphosphatase 4
MADLQKTYFRVCIFIVLTSEIANKDTADLRLKIANACLDDMIRWFAAGGQCGILDGSNTTEERRRELVERFKSVDVHYMFIESICDNPTIIDSNIRSVKVSSPDVCNFTLR